MLLRCFNEKGDNSILEYKEETEAKNRQFEVDLKIKDDIDFIQLSKKTSFEQCLGVLVKKGKSKESIEAALKPYDKFLEQIEEIVREVKTEAAQLNQEVLKKQHYVKTLERNLQNQTLMDQPDNSQTFEEIIDKEKQVSRRLL